ncbi:MAG: YbhB/YbcL family Raf kinase inhibitor-like protein [Verrucomicrobiota bacterium]|nr:YbhB/YbcL family Raf kinase inhibitor-like protein [Verrucomicrobiota bacterium]
MKPLIRLIFSGTLVIALTSQLFAASEISLSSLAFRAGEKIPEQFTCKGANINPPLQFPGVPAAARSLALIVEDPDAPNGLFTHWLVWNIDPNTRQIVEKSSPAGAIQGTNDFGKSGYGGPCPPSGTHRYFFRVFALDQKLALRSGAKRKELDQAMAGHILARGEMMGRCTR